MNATKQQTFVLVMLFGQIQMVHMNATARKVITTQVMDVKISMNAKKTPDICSGRRVICKNTNGSYECNCKEGYQNTSDGCNDIDECKTGAHKCDETTSQCQNLAGRYHCTCRTGFNKTQDKCVGKCFTIVLLFSLKCTVQTIHIFAMCAENTGNVILWDCNACRELYNLLPRWVIDVSRGWLLHTTMIWR